MRLSLRKGAWSVSTLQASAGNRGNGAPSCCVRERRMKFAHATNLDRKSGVAQLEGPAVVPTGSHADLEARVAEETPREALLRLRSRRATWD
jgi:hypothetical protein